MPRRAEITPRQPAPDAVHGSQLVAQLINRVMIDGKKFVAEQIVYDALASPPRNRTSRRPRCWSRRSSRSRPCSRSGRAASAAPTTRCRSRWRRGARVRSRSGGSSPTPASVGRRGCPPSSPASSSTRQPAGRRVQEERRHVPDGAGQQGFRALPLVKDEMSTDRDTRRAGPHPQHRHRRPHRCRQDHDERALPLLYRP